jgi:Carboxypeptidase regulatory-like domain
VRTVCAIPDSVADFGWVVTNGQRLRRKLDILVLAVKSKRAASEMNEGIGSSAMIRFATTERLDCEDGLQFPLEGATSFNTPLSSARKATWACILAVTVGVSLFAPRAASQEACPSCVAPPTFPESPFATISLGPQTTLNGPGEYAQKFSGSIAGTIADPSGAPIPGAVVRLTGVGESLPVQAESDEDGRFVFLSVIPEEFRLTISAQGFRTQEFSGTVHPGEHYLTPQIKLSLAEQMTQITVTPQTQEEIAEQQIKVQEKQRVFGFLPNFYVSYVHDAVPLTFKQKMKLAWKTSEDPITIGSAAAAAEIAQQRNWYRSYGHGAQGYAKRFGVTYGNVAIGTFLGSAVMPTVFKQDPRYFYKGPGSSWHSRLLYALSRSVIAKGDNGKWQPNYSNALGNLAAAGITDTYLPPKNRNVGFVFQSAGIRIVETAFADVFQEFISKKLTPRVSDRNTTVPEVRAASLMP